MELQIVAPSDTGTDVSQRTALANPDTLDRLGAAPGDPLAVTGTGRTVVTARTAETVAESALALAETDRESAGVDAGEVASVERVAVPVGDRVSAVVESDVDVRGGQQALERALRGHPVGVGDRVSVSVFGGSITVSFRVVETAPDGPVRVGDGTTVAVRDAGGGDGVTGIDRTLGAADLGGLDETLASVRRLVAAPLVDDSVVGALGGYPVGGVLLYGPRGVGKTRFATVVANETDARTLWVSTTSEFYDGALDGESLVAEAREGGPTLVVLDDVDVLAPAPDSGGSDQSAAELAAVLDALDDEADVAVLATATDPDAVDPRLRRGGRLSHEVELPVPDRAGRREVLDVIASDVALDGVDLDAVAARTQGFVGADLAELVSAAVAAAADRVGAADDPSEASVAVTPDDVAAALRRVVPSGMRAARIERPDVTYDDIGGLDDVKRELVRAAEWPIRYPELFEHLQSDPPSGALLYGPPGTGKTMLARAVANSGSANFISVEGPELFDRYVGESERAVREVFDRARENAPTVVFVDEIDALAADRDADADAGVADRVVSQLLTELDGLQETDDVVVIGATNRPDLVDPALLRPGRLEKRLAVGLPDREAREEILRIHTTDVPVGDLDYRRIAARTSGYTGSDVAAVVREASLLAMEDYLRDHSAESGIPDRDVDLVVEQSHFDRALDVVGPSVPEDLRDRYDDVSFGVE